MSDPRIERLLAGYIEQRVSGREPNLASLCAECPELVEPLRECIRTYEELDRTLDMPAAIAGSAAAEHQDLPQFEGFRTIERLGGGGGGEVYKLEDVELGECMFA